MDWLGQICLSRVASPSANAATASKSGEGLSAASIDFQVRVFISSASYNQAPHNERRSVRREKAVHNTSPAQKTTAQALHIGIFPGDLSLAVGRVRLKKLAGSSRTFGGGIDAFMREVPGLDSTHLGPIRAGLLEF